MCTLVKMKEACVWPPFFYVEFLINRNTDRIDLADLYRLKLIDLKLKIREHLFYPLNPRPNSRSIF